MPARKRAPEDRPSEGKQINFRAGPALSADLEDVAVGLGLDVSNLVRMILVENIGQYKARVKRLREEPLEG